MTRTLTLLFAVAGGAAVGNLYYVQPLLAVIAASLHVSSATAGLLVTATQVGYATGIVLVVPLGDVRDRRRLIPLMMRPRPCRWPCVPWRPPSPSSRWPWCWSG